MEGEELLDRLPNWVKQLVAVILLFGGICAAIIYIHGFLYDLAIPTARSVGNMTNMTNSGVATEWLWNYGLYIILVLVFSLVTFILTQREQDKTKKAENEVASWAELCRTLARELGDMIDEEKGHESSETPKTIELLPYSDITTTVDMRPLKEKIRDKALQKLKEYNHEDDANQWKQKAESPITIPENVNREVQAPRTENSLKKELNDYFKLFHQTLIEDYDPDSWISGIRQLLAKPSDHLEIRLYNNEHKESPADDKIKDVLGVMGSYVNYKYAQPELKGLITQYLLLRPRLEESKYQQEAVDVLNKMAPFVEKRYQELMDDVD